MPLRKATPYIVSPRCTLIVVPYLGCETTRCGEPDEVDDDVSRTTLLLHDANPAAASMINHAGPALDKLLLLIVPLHPPFAFHTSHPISRRSTPLAIQPTGSIQRCSAASARAPPSLIAPATR